MKRSFLHLGRRIVWRLMRLSGNENMSWDLQHRLGVWDVERKSPILLRKVERLCAGGSILEFGCGDGSLPLALSSQAFSKYIGYDISGVGVEACRKRVKDPHIRYEQANMATWRADDVRADLIVCEECIYYLSSNQIRDFIEECAKALGYDGYLLVVIHSIEKHKNVVSQLRADAVVEEEEIVGSRVYMTLKWGG